MVQKYKKVLGTSAHLQNKYTIHTKINYRKNNHNVEQEKTGSKGSQVGGWVGVGLGGGGVGPRSRVTCCFLFFFLFCHVGNIYTQ